jgi:hypothetical protein
VLPRTFDFDSIFAPGSEIDLITPFPLTPETANWGNTLFGIGRLRSGVGVAQAQAELTIVSERLHQTINRGGKFGAVVKPIGEALRGRFRGPFFALTGAVACVPRHRLREPLQPAPGPRQTPAARSSPCAPPSARRAAISCSKPSPKAWSSPSRDP